MVKFEGRVTVVGPYVSEFINSKLLVLFGEDAPEEVAEFSVLHNASGLSAPLAAGDTFYLDTTGFRVLAVGEIANDNLANLGHVVLKFNDLLEPEMPGDLCLQVRDIPPVVVGMTLRVEG
jgi:PTS system glucitol/sorbitol-specific IIA component